MQLKSIFVIALTMAAFSTQAAVRDSIGVENNNGKKVIIYKVEAKETYYSIGRKYGVSPKEIMELNKSIDLKIGTVIKVPMGKAVAVPASHPAATHTTPVNKIPVATQPVEKAPEQAQTKEGQIIQHKVEPKETLYSISRKYNASVEELKQMNNLSSTNLRVGQTIKVKSLGEMPVTPGTTTPAAQDETRVQPKQVEEHDADSTSSMGNPRLKLPASRYGLNQVTEKGTAMWIVDPDLDATKMYALHKNAPIGTIIKVTNPMTNRTTFAKVVGKFTENESTKDVIIVLTKAAADALGALDKRFFCNITYGVPSNE